MWGGHCCPGWDHQTPHHGESKGRGGGGKWGKGGQKECCRDTGRSLGIVGWSTDVLVFRNSQTAMCAPLQSCGGEGGGEGVPAQDQKSWSYHTSIVRPKGFTHTPNCCLSDCLLSLSPLASSLPTRRGSGAAVVLCLLPIAFLLVVTVVKRLLLPTSISLPLAAVMLAFIR